MYSDDEAAALYDVLNGWAADNEFYLALTTGAESVLDVGCGTGTMLRRVRENGHSGRLCGIDPDEAALRRARRFPGAEWVSGTAASMTFAGEFDLAIMMSNAFQCLVDDDDLRASLRAIRRALRAGGRFAFETRNPAVRAWDEWNPGNPFEVTDPAGRRLRMWYEVEAERGDVITLTENTAEPDGTVLRVDRSELRFLDADTLDSFLAEAGFTVQERYGDWPREPFTPESRQIITVAGTVGASG